ncbi:MAG: protein kinase [Deltaproteobacteria bacterium]|nr:protein kinase [Deltaproteobacteria bacterium]
MPSVTPSDDLVGTILASKYKVLREIGRGGMAVVFEARHVEIGKRVAVKVLAEDLAASSQVVERFIREARAAAAVDSPFICAVHDVDRLADGRPFLVLDYLQGESLFQRMNRVPRFDPQDAVRIFSQVARGLAKAHEAGIIHRDLKPENVFLARDDEGEETAKIVDFGLAKFYAPSGDGPQKRLTRDGMLFGTPLYMSPEQVTQQGTIDHRVDLWALGCMVFETLTGRSVWDNDRGVAMVLAQIAAEKLPIPSKIRPDLPPAFDAWFVHALQRDPDKRFQNARVLAQDLATAFGIDAARPPFASLPGLFDVPAEPSVRVALPAGMPRGHDGSLAALTTTDADSKSDPGRHPTLEASVPGAAQAPQIRYTSGSQAPKSLAVERAGPEHRPRRTLLWVGLSALGVGLLVAGIYGAARVSKRRISDAPAPVAASTGVPLPASGAASAPLSQAAASAPAEPLAPWVEALRQAQELLAKGNLPDAIKGFERAAELNDAGSTRMMLDHVRIAAAGKGTCKLNGLARPRPLEWVAPSRHGQMVAVGAELFVSWLDEHRGASQWGMSGAWLDSALRSKTPVDLTPEGASVADAKLLEVGGRWVALYGEGGGNAPGVHLRSGELTALASSKPLRLSESRTSAAHPTIAPFAGAGAWIAWADDPDKVSSNIYARMVDASMQAPTAAVQLTRFAGIHGPVGPRATSPVAAILGDRLLIAYLVERGRYHEILLQRIALADPQLARGVAEWGRPPRDMVVGAITKITPTALKVGPPEMACGEGACIIAWRSQPTGSHLAMIDISTGAVKWRKVASPQGTQVGVGLDDKGGGLAAWYEDGRVRVAPLGEDGVGPASAVGRVHGDQPSPSVAWNNGAWVVGWTSFEAGHPEPYLARVTCS